jgi:gluconolactonase
LIFAKNGDLYFTDQGSTGLHDPTGCVYRYTTGGKLECLIDSVPSPNGLVFNRRESELFVAVTRANAVWRIPLDDAGGVSKVGLFVQLFSAGPDGLALDDEGNVVVTHPGLGLVWLFSKRGEPLYQVKSCAGEMTTNIAYGGADRKTLYIVDSAKANILAARMPIAGKLMYSHL